MPIASSSDGTNNWDEIANKYIEIAEGKKNRSYIQLSDEIWVSLGDVRNLDVLDIGCGHGWLSEQLTKAGARVTAIDASSRMLEYARSRVPNIRFIQHDLENGLPALTHPFDRIIANMVLMNLSDIGKVISSVRKLLRPDGKFIFSITHPCFFHYEAGFDHSSGKVFRKVLEYLKPSVWRVESFGGHNHYHRSLSYYFDHLARNGLAVTRFYEPLNTPRFGSHEEFFSPYLPVFILFESIPLSIQPHI